jgi:uncharacterized protein YkwD
MAEFYLHPKRIALAVALSLGLALPVVATTFPVATASATSACPDAHLAPTAANLATVAAATLCLVNQERQKRGIAPLQPNPALAAAAARFSHDMVAHNYFAHVTPTGVNVLARVRRAGYLNSFSGYRIAENIAAATGSSATPAGTVRLWMRSAGHRANILNPAYRDTGIGVAVGVPSRVGRGRGATYTEDFGTTS